MIIYLANRALSTKPANLSFGKLDGGLRKEVKTALKEWDIITEALGNGEVVAIWRKGGIADNPSVKIPFEGFTLLDKRFILFPTHTHEESEKIKSHYWKYFPQSLPNKSSDQIQVKYWAKVDDEIPISNIEQLLKIAGELVYSDQHLVSSWNLNQSHKGKLLILRVYKFSDPILISNSPTYSGCKSWVELNINIPKIGSEPVLLLKDFNQKVKQLKTLIKSEQKREEVVV